MRQYLWVVVFVVGVGLVAAYWSQGSLVSGKNGAQPETKPTAQEQLLHFDRSKVVGLEFHHPGSPAIVITRQANDRWLLESPFLAPADAYLVDRSVMTLNMATVAGQVPNARGELAQFGLGDRMATTKVVLRTQGEPLSLELGGTSPNGSLQYVRTSERNDVVLTETKYVRGFPKSPTDVLERKIFPLADEPLSMIEIKEGSASIVLQAGDKRWMMASPVHGPTDVQAMTEWLKRVTHIKAQAVRSADDMDPLSTAHRVGSFRMTAGRATVTTDLYRSGEHIVALRSDQPHLRFVMPAAVLPSIFPEPFALRDKHLIDAEGDDVAVVELRQQGAPVRLNRTMAGWFIDGRRLSHDATIATESWVKELQTAQGIELISALEGCHVKHPGHWDVTLRGPDGQVLGRVELARTAGCGDVATLPSGEWIKLQGPALIDRIPSTRLS